MFRGLNVFRRGIKVCSSGYRWNETVTVVVRNSIYFNFTNFNIYIKGIAISVTLHMEHIVVSCDTASGCKQKRGCFVLKETD